MPDDPLAPYRREPRPASTEPTRKKEEFDLGLYTALNDLVFMGDLEQASEVLAREAGEERRDRPPIDQRLLGSLAELKGAEEDHQQYVAVRDKLFAAQTKARGVLEEALALQGTPNVLDDAYARGGEHEGLSEVKPQLIRLLETFEDFIRAAERDHGENYWAIRMDINQVFSKIYPERERAAEEAERRYLEQDIELER